MLLIALHYFKYTEVYYDKFVGVEYDLHIIYRNIQKLSTMSTYTLLAIYAGNAFPAMMYFLKFT